MLCESCKNILYKRVAILLAVAAGGLAAVGAVSAHRERTAAPSRPAAALPGGAPFRSFAIVVATGRKERAARAEAARERVRRADPKPTVRPRATISLYERTVDPMVLRRQGCAAARRGVGGVVILDFGKPSWNGSSYGTILFSGRFAGNHAITRALYGYAHAYVRCSHSAADRITLARGTSNYHPSVPSTYKAGRKWADETVALARMLDAHGLAGRVTSAAADDVEPAWDRTWHRTRDFYRGYADVNPGRLLYNYGSLDGGIGKVWSAKQAFFVAGGMRYARAIPEIYNNAMAREWAALSQVALHRYHRSVQFAGVMTEHTSANHGLKPRDAHRALVRQLAVQSGPAAADVPATLTNITAGY